MSSINQAHGQQQCAADQNALANPALKNALEFRALVKTLGLSLQVRDQNFNMLAGRFNSVDDLFHSPEFLSRLDQTLYLCDATGTNWLELTIKKGRIVSFSIVLSMKIRWTKLYIQGGGGIDILYVGYRADADSKDVTTAIPLSEFRPERIPKYFPYVVGETTHDSKEIGKLMCYLLSPYINNPNPKSTTYLGRIQGFAKNNQGKIQFNPSGPIPEALNPYLSSSILSRQAPFRGDAVSEDMTPILVPLFSGSKWLLIALLFRVASWMQFLFAWRDVYADNVIELKPTPIIPISLLVALMTNTRYDNLDAPPVGPNIKPLRFDLETVNDGVVVVVDTFAADQVKKAEKGYDLLIQDVCGAAGSSSAAHHIIALISGYAELHLPQDKYCVLKLDEDLTACSPSYYRTALKRLDASLIRNIEHGCDKGNLGKTFQLHVDDVRSNIPDTIPVSKRNIYTMLVTALRMYNEFYSPLFAPDFEREIEEWLISQEQDRQSLEDLVCSEYCEILNKKIADGCFQFTLKQDVTLVDKGSHTIVVDPKQRCIYIETADDQDIAVNEMQSIGDTDSLTTALYNCNYLPHTSKDEKSVRMAAKSSDGKRYTRYAHKMKYGVLEDDNLALLDLIDKDAFLFRQDELMTENFLPLVKTVDGRFAGKMLIYETEENNIYFGTGKSGTGKSWAIAQILCMLLMLGHNVVVFDVSRTYTRKELYGMLPREVVDKLFSFISVGVEQSHIPIDLGLLEGCKNLSDKKNMIYRLLAAALGKTDPDKAVASRKKKALQLFLSEYLRDKNDTIDFVDMLSEMEKDSHIDTDIIESLFDIFSEIDEIGCDRISWGKLFERENRILVIDLGNEVSDDTHVMLDILAASLFSWQMQHDSKFLSIAVDELKDQNFAPNSILRSIITDGRRFHTALIGATQDYFDPQHPQLDAMRQANIQSFCRPGKSEDKIAQRLGYTNADDTGFNKFKPGDIVMDFDAYSKETDANEPITLRGRVVNFIETPFYDRFRREYGAD